MKMKHFGSNFDDFLESQGMLEEFSVRHCFLSIVSTRSISSTDMPRSIMLFFRS